MAIKFAIYFLSGPITKLGLDFQNISQIENWTEVENDQDRFKTFCTDFKR